MDTVTTHVCKIDPSPSWYTKESNLIHLIVYTYNNFILARLIFVYA